jgi:cobalt-precorrin 5A hydrolase/precorrin-3B C17-methyltransferase
VTIATHEHGADGPRVLTLSVTERGRALAAKLPFEHHHGGAGQALRESWSTTEAFVVVLAIGATVRLIAPLLGSKTTDPAVVCIDDAGRFVVPIVGGHAGGGNDLARHVAALLGAEAVITTASDATGHPGLDDLPGLRVEGERPGDLAALSAALLDGRTPMIVNEMGWPMPSHLELGGSGPERLVVTDRVYAAEGQLDVAHAATVLMRPPSLVAGVGASTGAPPDEVSKLVDDALSEAGLSQLSLGEVATIDRRAGDPAIIGLGLAVRAFDAAQLAGVVVPNPSDVVRAAVGTPSVCEAAALLAAGPGAELVVTKRSSAHATVAVARRRRPRGHLAVVGLGPGHAAHRTPAADAAVRHAEVVVGYAPYVEQCADLIRPSQTIIRSAIGAEVERTRVALGMARAGMRVALVCSGDAGVYAMASLVMEEQNGDCDIDVIPGVTAALATAALLGAPLGHDHLMLSLSDLLTPWELIEERVAAAAAADLVMVLYNPRSRGRSWQLDRVREIVLAQRSPSTPVGVVTDAGRPAQRTLITALGELDVEEVGMTSCVIIGSSTTHMVAGRLVTPRGYRR